MFNQMLIKLFKSSFLNWFFLLTFLLGFSSTSISNNRNNSIPANRIILFVWDGLRPDSVSQENTPHLYALMKHGVQFKDNHATYPTFTMMNAASFATGDFPAKTGFFGNTLWHPHIEGKNAEGKKVNFQEPVFTEDYKILQDLDKDALILVGTLFQVAHQNGLKTATVGKSGPAFLQDFKSQNIILDEKHVYPLSFAKRLQERGYTLPKLSTFGFGPGKLVLKVNNGNPTAFGNPKTLIDDVTSDPTNKSGSPYAKSNQYLMNIYLNEILPKEKPQLSVVWLRDPDSTEHNFGPGSFNYKAALTNNDNLLGQLISKIKQLNDSESTDIIVVSDHGHSNVSGPVSEFPLHSIQDGWIKKFDYNGYSVSGEIRTADLLTKAGFHAYDGEGCRYNPVLSGITSQGMALYPTQIDRAGKICGQIGAKYNTPSYKVPAERKMPKDAIVIATNGGSEYFYIPSHNKKIFQKLVTFLQSHEQYDAIFINDNYGSIDGTLPMSKVDLENKAHRSPDIIVGLSYNTHTKINGLPGIEFSDMANYRGMHGSFSPIDVHNYLAASGPDFRRSFQDYLPSGNIDVAPTIAHILKLNLPNTDGRVLYESLRNAPHHEYSLKKIVITPKHWAKNLEIINALSHPMACHHYSAACHRYTIILRAKLLGYRDRSYTYFDSAKAIRE